MKSSPHKEKHHWVPKSYLERFCNEGKLSAEWIKGKNKGVIFSPTPNAVCNERGLNDLSKLPTDLFPGVPPRFFEDILSIIDGNFSSTAKKSIDIGKFPDEKQTTTFGFFCYNLLGRSKFFQDFSAKAIKKMDLNEKQREVLDIFPLRAFCGIVATQNDALKNASYKIIKSPQGHRFISSDNPATLWVFKDGKIRFLDSFEKKGIGYKKEDQILHCPLSPTFFLTLSPRDNGGVSIQHIIGTPKDVKCMNEKTRKGAYKLIFK